MLLVGLLLVVLPTACGRRFSAVWNCPYMGRDVVGKFGLSANPSGGFNGTVITMFYGPKTWPSLKAVENPAVNPCWSGKHPCSWDPSEIWANITVVSNGGVPQAGDIVKHKAAVEALVTAMIPDPLWTGYGIFDWEAWRALYRENDDGLSYSNYYSTLLVRRQHPDWTNTTQIEAEAEQQFNAGAKLFFTETLRAAKRLRPHGKFGFYEYPMAPLPELTWLWQEVGVMAGSQYLRPAASTAASVNDSLTAVRLAEAAARAAGTPFVRPDILTYVWLWPGATPVSAEQLTASIRTPAAMGADGIILWGSSSDAHVPGYAGTITSFLRSDVGPLIEKCTANRAQCAAAFCSGHGRCADYDADHPEQGCERQPTRAADVTCLCDVGHQGAACDLPAASPVLPPLPPTPPPLSPPAAAAAAAAVTGVAPSYCDEDGDWKVVWEDTFDASTLDRSTWTVPTGVGSSFGRDANVTDADTYVKDGMLVLRSRQLGPGSWTTGAAITHDRSHPNNLTGKAWRYGRFCIRAKLPGGGPGKSQGLWPAHWMMPSEHTEHCGYNEIDIMEMIDGNNDAWGTYWYWGPEGGGKPGAANCSGPPVRAGEGHVVVPSYYTQFHEYSVEWTPSSLTYLVDGTPYKTYTNRSMLPVNPHYLMLNTAVGGAWPGVPNASSVFPAYHYIDFVRVAQKSRY